MRLRLYAVKMTFLHRVAGLTLRDSVERSQLRFGHPGRLPPELLQTIPTGRRSWGRDRTHWRVTYLIWLGHASGSWKMLLGRGTSGLPCLACCHCNPALDKQQKMDGWMDGWILNPALLKSIFTSMQSSSSLPLLVHCSISWSVTATYSSIK